jgi:hypothetical protein
MTAQRLKSAWEQVRPRTAGWLHEGFRVAPLLVLLLLFALGIHGKSSRAIAPPIYDPLHYIEKGQRFFSEIRDHHFPNPLEVQPPFRPPGYLPFFFPTGYHGVRSFLFWSMFSPLAVWLLALWVAFRPKPRGAGHDGISLSLCAGLAALPMFFQFEINYEVSRVWVGQWGLVDTLCAAVSALAAVWVVRGVRDRNLLLTSLGWGAVGYTAFIKPAGLVIMVAIGGIWFVEVLLQWTAGEAPVTPRRSLGRFVLVSALAGLAIYGVCVALCLTSSYLSLANLSMGANATAFFRKAMAGPSLAQVLVPFVRPTFGWHWFVPLALVYGAGLIAAIRNLVKHRFHALLVRLAAGALLLLAGGYWWLAFAGPEVRYYYPFILIVLVWLGPELLPGLQRVSLGVRRGVVTLCLWSPAALVVLLWMDAPPVPVQQALGVNLSSGGYGELVAEANRIIAEAEASGRSPCVYMIKRPMLDNLIYTIDYLKGVENRRPPAIRWVNPADWLRESGVRYSDAQMSDYMHYPKEGWLVLPHGSKIDDFRMEVGVFGAWLQTLGTAQGVVPTDNGDTRILKVVDRAKFLAAYKDFAAMYEHRPEFKKNNPELFPPKP